MAADSTPIPVTPNPSPEAAQLLRFIHEISGKRTLSGQHCAPLHGSTRLVVVQRQTGTYPALFGQDFGFDGPGCWDGINFRQNIVDEAIRRYHEGFIITLMWHAVRPIEEEPVTFEECIQGKVSAAEWRDLITPGTRINERWKSQVDVIAWFLRQLRDAGVPVLWRPYHEMNGFWFWWCARPGENGYQKLWRMLYDRLVNFHGLNNLLWVFNGNEVKEKVANYADFYPGHDVVDVLATDVYTGRYDEENYRQLLALAGTKPIALGEVGSFPTVEKLKAQPRWTWFMSWRDPDNFFWNKESDLLRGLFNYNNAVSLEDLPWSTLKGDIKIHHPVLE
jgi:mannan endo-1,4-beta-mannosidase